MPNTPFFPAWRARLANLGRHVHHLQQHSLVQLDGLLAPLLPAGVLAEADDGPNSRERIYQIEISDDGNSSWKSLTDQTHASSDEKIRTDIAPAGVGGRFLRETLFGVPAGALARLSDF